LKAALTTACTSFALLGGAAPLDFNRDIRPILSDHCYACHGPDEAKRKAGLRLDVRENAFQELKSGARAIVPGDVSNSALVRRITSNDPDEVMPPPDGGKPLSLAQIELLTRWVKEGAPWAKHWAFVPPERPPLPAVKHPQWPRNEIDYFTLARLEQAGLAPNPEADRATLIRRVSLDLTGLPPTIEEVDAFLADQSPDAYERLVDRLLASPHYGERLAQNWLDLARYADTSGYHFDGVRFMWLWRDWVINAFNQNKPFDEFTVEQLAGDLLPHPTREQRIATGFVRNNMTNDEGGADPDEYLNKYVVDRVNTLGAVWLGLTVGCAECHDHKFDPLTTKEFYQLYAFFHNVPEKGLDRIRTDNPPPRLPVPTVEQALAFVEADFALKDAEKTLQDRINELGETQEKWERETRARPPPPPNEEGLVAVLPFDVPAGRVSSPDAGSSDGVVAPETRGDEVRAAASGPSPGAQPGQPSHAEHLVARVRQPGGLSRVEGKLIGAEEVAFAVGRLGQALKLDGKAHAEFGPLVAFDRTNAFSYSAWIQLESDAGCVLSQMEPAPSYRGFDLFVSDRRLEVHLVHQWPDNALKVRTKEPVPKRQWLHVVVTYDGSSKAGGIRLYLDGRLRELDPQQDRLTDSFANTEPLRLGARAGASPFTGLIDDVRFYERALSEEDVRRLVFHGYAPILAKSRGQRSDEERADLARFYKENYAVDYLRSEAALAKARQRKEQLYREIPTTMIMEEMDPPRDTFVLVRGDYTHKGERVGPATPAFLPPLPEGPPNRLSLARWLVSREHPLTARVTVNRYWAMFFGTGLVKTLNDFGSQGEWPSHPELLDWLACEFMAPGEADESLNGFNGSGRTHGAKEARSGEVAAALPQPGGRLSPSQSSRLGPRRPWDVKALVRLIVTSATYRQSAHVTPEKLERDPYNRLFTRGPRLRLDAEFIRDNALAVAGLLNPSVGGPSVKPYQPPGIWDGTDAKYEQDHGEDLYRRGLYVFWRRSAHYPSFAAFDAPNREVCTFLRQRTQTPLQSLVLMNDPVYVEAARALATRVWREAPADPNQRLVRAFRHTLARKPEPAEIALLRRTYDQQLVNFREDPPAAQALLQVGESRLPADAPPAELAALTAVANVLLNLNETITK
jgi:hypothetical protein